ncbi:MAG: hypothetical protein JW841_12285 [Deltaproteobacteria bacterium]|nr:hypothetical protein [Deltaproteobacteria bacterium]
MSEHLIKQGFKLFIAGDFLGAGRLWLDAYSKTPDDPLLLAYLDHLHEVSPATLDELKATEKASEKSSNSQLPVQISSQLNNTTNTNNTNKSDPWLETTTDNDDSPLQVDSNDAGLKLINSVLHANPLALKLSKSTVIARMQKLMSVDNFSGAYEIAQTILRKEPDNIEAQRIANICREQLETMYLNKIGELSNKPAVLMSPEEIIWLDLDHRSGFVFAQVDGTLTYEEIIELTGMARLETLSILCDLVNKGAIR